MEIDVTPPVDDDVGSALREALRARHSTDRPAESAWQRAGLAEAVEREEGAVFSTYAFSPRSTRGATRA